MRRQGGLNRLEAGVKRAALKIATLPGVVGVFRGVRRRNGRWTDEPVLTVFVRHKRKLSTLPVEQRLRSGFDGIAVDVVAVGSPRAHSQVDTTEMLIADRTRESSITALVAHPNGGMVALGSGHGLLPIANNAYQSGRWDADEYPIQIDGANVSAGSLWFGETGADCDFATVRFSDLSPPAALNGHVLAQAPIRLASRAVHPPEFVQHWAAWRRFRITGKIVASSLQTLPIVLTSNDGIDTAYRDVIAVVGDRWPFSVPGESGSLVFDENRRAIGMVIGAGTDPDAPDLHVTFVLRAFDALRAALGRGFSLFFTGSS